MLRVMKQKVKEGSADELSRQSSEDSSPGLSLSVPIDITHVTEVPQSISIPSSQVPPSSCSSVSSDGLHILAPMTRIIDDVTTTGGLHRISVLEDSPCESSAIVSDKGSTNNNTSASKRKNDVELPHKVSELNLEESASLHDVSAASSTSKRRKVNPPCESSAIESDKGSTNNNTNASKRKNDCELPHKVSDLNLEESASVHHVSAASSTSKRSKIAPPQRAVSSLRLLAMPEDSSALNALHTFVRMQIEVFAATPADMAQPAPGRKTPIKLHQIGLRCIHCSHMQSRDRIKRAVCYPSSVSRIYHSVSDMKFDHFNHCRGFTQDLRAKFQVLKEECKRRREIKAHGSSSSSTAQYYHDSACKLGLVDSIDKEGIFLVGQECHQLPASVFVEVYEPKPHTKPSAASSTGAPTDTSSARAILPSQGTVDLPVFPGGFPAFSAQMLAMYHTLQNYNSMFLGDLRLPLTQQSPSSFPTNNTTAFEPSTIALEPSKSSSSAEINDQLRLLAVPEDSTALNPLHCFVRRNVEVFIATKDDVAAPSPGRRTRVKIGQVGIRCIHCARLPTKDRVKRAVCYPPSVSGIYHSVSNMKFDHFGNCKGLSPEARLEFASLKNSSNRRNSPSGNGNRGVVSSTAQYYEESASRLGLIDKEGGIQFREQRLKVNDLVSGQGTATDGISALMIAATNPSVRAEFDRRKALMGNLGTSQTLASV